MQEFNQIMEEIHKAYLESNDTNKKHIIKILLTFHKIITDKDNDKNLESIERHLTRKVIYQDFADKKKLDLLSLRNCFVHKQFKDIDVLDYSRLIWATFENVSSEIKYDELRNFLAYLFRIRIESEEEQNKQEKLVKTYKQLFRNKNKEQKIHILMEIAMRMFNDFKVEYLIKKREY